MKKPLTPCQYRALYAFKKPGTTTQIVERLKTTHYSEKTIKGAISELLRKELIGIIAFERAAYHGKPGTKTRIYALSKRGAEYLI
jgi:predicted transcriptional regulator